MREKETETEGKRERKREKYEERERDRERDRREERESERVRERYVRLAQINIYVPLIERMHRNWEELLKTSRVELNQKRGQVKDRKN